MSLQEQGYDPSSIKTGNPFKFKKCTFTGHAATIWSVDHAIQVLDHIGSSKDSEDSLPFAIHVVDGCETIQIAEDNGEFAGGEILADVLSKLKTYNVLVCVTRKLSGSFVLDMHQSQRMQAIKEAAKSAVDVLHDHLTGGTIKKMKVKQEIQVEAVTAPEVITNTDFEKRGFRKALPPKSLSIDETVCLPERSSIQSVEKRTSAASSNQKSFTKGKNAKYFDSCGDGDVSSSMSITGFPRR